MDFFALGWGRGEGLMWEDLFVQEFFMRERNFDEGGAGFSSIKKKIEKIKTFCSTGSN